MSEDKTDLFLLDNNNDILSFLSSIEETKLTGGAIRTIIERVCLTALKYRNKVLTIFCLDAENINTKDIFKEYLRYMSLIELKEEAKFGDRVKAFLNNLAYKFEIELDKLFGLA